MQIEFLAEQVLKSAANKPRHILAIAGPPGSGKSTLSSALLEELLARNERAKIVPMDGFHFDNGILSQKGMLSRKGSPPTFDVAGFINLIGRLNCGEDNVAIPVFDRDRDASIAGAELITLNDQILIVEGNYLLLNKNPWLELKKFWNQTVFINVAPDELEKRLINRWVEQGLDMDAAREQARSNDLINADLVLNSSSSADIQIG